ncbi:Phage envelope protein [Legionella beliardensis]|uniref:Phage envelope protein n=2 Tax=Legionella beliardensis TaxID=91822 RepID=A0A378I4U0_9GAMM|nr:Phage envelope protein [Legionella beliardensis]
MNINVINECTELSFEGNIKFPDVIKQLAANKVERYLVDLVGKQKLNYGADNNVYTESLPLNGQAVSPTFDVAAIKSAILDSQQNKINYPDFLDRIIASGCSHYEVFITGRKVIYFGRDGSQHIELFP